MDVKFNPRRAGLFAALIVIWLVCRWVSEHFRLPQGVITLPALDQTHTVAAWAILAITAVAIVKLLKRR